MNDDIAELLKELQRTYLASLPEKTAALRELWQKCEFKLLKTDFHKLKGTGRTYGLPEISQIGEAMESICRTEETAALTEAMPLALDLLAEIASERNQGRVPVIENDPKFKQIVRIAAPVG